MAGQEGGDRYILQLALCQCLFGSQSVTQLCPVLSSPHLCPAPASKYMVFNHLFSLIFSTASIFLSPSQGKICIRGSEGWIGNQGFCWEWQICWGRALCLGSGSRSLCCVPWAHSEHFWNGKAETLGTHLCLNPSFVMDLLRVLGQVPFLVRVSVS